jgi:hypothetical protein
MKNDLLQVEVITHVLGSMNHCAHCQVFIDGVGVGDRVHQDDLASFPPEWMEEWKIFSDLIANITERYAGKLVVKITDAQSPQAMWMALRHGIRKYPTFIVEGENYHGLDEDRLIHLIERHLVQQL